MTHQTNPKPWPKFSDREYEARITALKRQNLTLVKIIDMLVMALKLSGGDPFVVKKWLEGALAALGTLIEEERGD